MQERDGTPGSYASCVTVTGEEIPLQRPGVEGLADRISAKAMCRVLFVAGIARDARGG